MENTNSFSRSSMTYGLITGMALVFYSLILFILDIRDSGLAGFVNWLIFFIGIYMGIRSFRDNVQGGYITYSRSLGFGTLVSFFAAIFMAIYTFILFKYLDPNALELSREIMEEAYFERGFDEDQVDLMMSMADRFATPGLYGFSSLLSFTFTGFIISLIVGLFTRKDGDGFSRNMSRIKDE